MVTEAFVVLIILINFLEVPEWGNSCNRDLQVVELFAGVARISRLAAWLGLKSRAYDLTYLPIRNPYKQKRGKRCRSPMDLNGSAGLRALGWMMVYLFTFSHGAVAGSQHANAREVPPIRV